MKILVIDDDYLKIGQVKEALWDLEINVTGIFPSQFGDGTNWVDYQIVILDYEMSPRGPEIASKIREDNSRVVLIGYSMLWELDASASELVDEDVKEIGDLVRVIKSIISTEGGGLE